MKTEAEREPGSEDDAAFVERMANDDELSALIEVSDSQSQNDLDRLIAIARRATTLPQAERIVAGTAAERDVLAERKRQVEVEGWTAKHDDGHEEGELALAACCYASPQPLYLRHDYASEVAFRDPWPFEGAWDKREYEDSNVFTPNEKVDPAKRRDMLIKSGALILAEIDRLDRSLKSPEPQTNQGARDD